MTAQTVTQAWMLAQAYREKYEQYLPVLQHNIPGATASVHDDHFPITAINQLAYAFMIMANTDVKVGYSAEIATYEREDKTRALGALVNFSRVNNSKALKSATIILNNNLPSSVIICSLIQAFGWLLQNNEEKSSGDSQDYFELPLTVNNLYDDAQCDNETYLDLNRAGLFALFFLIPDKDLLAQLLSAKSIDDIAAQYDLPVAAIKNRLMLGIHLNNEGESRG